MRLAAGIVLFTLFTLGAGLFPGRAVAHLDANLVGVPPSDLSEWNYHGISVKESVRWIDEGIIFAAWAAQWREEGFSPESAGKWHQITNVYTAGDFLRNGFSPEETSEWLRQGVKSGQRAREYLAAGFDAQEASTFWKKGIYPDEARAWRKAGFNAGEMLQWRYGARRSKFYFTKESTYSRDVYSLEFASAWRDAGFLPEEAQRAITYRFELTEAKSWKEAGFSFGDFVAWKDSGFTLEEALANRVAGLGPIDSERRRYEAAAKEDEISELHAEITVNKDGTLDIVESATIVDRPGGAYREGYDRYPLPGEVRAVAVDGLPGDYAVAGSVLQVRRNGAPLPEGEHRIVLTYTADTLVENEPHHDELRFPLVAGIGPGSYLRSVAATVRLPPGAHVIFADGLAGRPERKDFVTEVEATRDGDVVRYSVTRPLREGMAFSLRLGFVKGYTQPSWWQRFGLLDRQSMHFLSSLLLFLGGLGVCTLYYGTVWLKVGRDPKGRGLPLTEFSPPVEIGPAGMRALMTRGKTDHLSMAAQLLSLAACGVIRIFEAEGAYKIAQVPNSGSGLTARDQDLLAVLFSAGEKIILTGGSGKKPLKEAGKALRLVWAKEYRKTTRQNTRYLWPGIVLSMLFLGAALAVLDKNKLDQLDHAGVLLFFYLALLVFGFGALTLLFARLLRRPSPEHVQRLERSRAYGDFLRRSFSDLETRTHLPPFLQDHLPYAMASGMKVEHLLLRSSEAKWYKGAAEGFACGDFLAMVKKSM